MDEAALHAFVQQRRARYICERFAPSEVIVGGSRLKSRIRCYAKSSTMTA